MNKETFLSAIADAIKAHKSQMKKIENALDGDIIENPTAPEKTKCAFGHWLYDTDNHVKEIIGAQFFIEIETIHTKWHSEYLRVFNILFRFEKKVGFFSKLLSKNKIDEMELDKAKAYYAELQETTKQLLKIMEASQRRVDAMHEAKFNLK